MRFFVLLFTFSLTHADFVDQDQNKSIVRSFSFQKEATQAYSAYEAGGPVAALKQLGIEVVTDVVGGAALRMGGKAIYKVGGVVYPSVKSAVNAVLDQTPGLRVVLGGLTDKLIKLQEGAALSTLGQAAARAEARLVDFERRSMERLGLKQAPLPKPEDRPLSSEYYSTAFRVRLKEGVHYPTRDDRIHFQEANKQLYHKIQKDPAFGKQMETLYPGITKAVSPGPRGAFPRKSPLGLTWHHNAHERGVLDLVPWQHHESKGIVQANLHPQGKGGQQIWGGGRK